MDDIKKYKSVLEIPSLFWRFHFVPSPAISSATSDVFSCMELPGGGQAPTRHKVQACCMAVYCLLSQVAVQFPFPLLLQKGCFFLQKCRRIKSKTSPDRTGWNPDVFSPSPAHSHKFRLLCSFCPYLFSVLGNQVACLQR